MYLYIIIDRRMIIINVMINTITYRATKRIPETFRYGVIVSEDITHNAMQIYSYIFNPKIFFVRFLA